MATKRYSLAEVEGIQNKFGEHINSASSKYGVDKDLLTMVIAQESAGNPNAKSPKGASGLMQIMPDTFKGLTGGVEANPFDPKTSIEYGAKHLGSLLKRYGGDEKKALAAYNAGEGNVDKHNGIPPFKETQDYVASITTGKKWKKEQDKLPKYQKEYLSPSPYNYSLDKAFAQKNSDSIKFQNYVRDSISRSSATFSDEVNSIWTAIDQASPLGKALDEINIRNWYKPDSNYAYDQSVASVDFAKRGISYDEETLDFMSKSRSMQDYVARLDLLQSNQAQKDFAMKSITASTFEKASLVGGIAGDPTAFISLYGIPKAIKTMSLATRASYAYGGAFGIQATMALVKDEYVAGYGANEAIIDTVLGTVIDGTLARGLFKPKSVVVNPSDVVTIRESVLNSVASNPIAKTVATSRGYKWSSSGDWQPPKRWIDEPFTDVEFYDTAKQLGYKQDDIKLIEDKNVRSQIEEEIKKKKEMSPEEDVVLKPLKDAEKKVADDITDNVESSYKEKTDSDYVSSIDKMKYIAKSMSLFGIVGKEAKAKMGISIGEFSYKDALNNRLKNYTTKKGKELATVLTDMEAITKSIGEINDSIEWLSMDKAKNADKISELRAIRKELVSKNKEVRDKFDKIDSEYKAELEADAVKARRELAINDGKKQFDTILKQISKHIDSKVKKLESITKKADEATKKVDGLDAKSDESIKALERQKEIFERMKSAVDELTASFEESLNSLMISRFLNDTDRKVFLKELADAINDEFGSNVKLAFKDGKIVSKGNIKFDIKGRFATNKYSKLQLALGSALALSATASFAGEGDNDGFSYVNYIIGIGLALGFGSVVVKNVLDRRDMVKTIEDYNKGIKDIEREAVIKSDPFYKKIAKAVTSVDNYRTGYLESMAYIIKHGTPEQIKLAKQLVRDWVDPQKGIASESDKLSNVRSRETVLKQESDRLFSKWLDETNQKEGLVEHFALFGMETPTRRAFEEAAMDFIEYGGDVPASIKEYAKAVKKERDLVADYAEASGVDGFQAEKRAKFKDTYMSRFVNRGNLQKAVGTAEGRTGLAKALTASIAKAINKSADDVRIQKLAEDYIDVMSKTHLSHNAIQVPDVEAMLKKMEELGMDVKGFDVENFIKEVHRDSDIVSRGKLRIPMDFRAFGKFVAKIDGEDVIFDAGMIFDRNAQNVARRYMNQMYGYSAAVRLTGVSSYGRLLDMASKGHNAEVAVKLKTYIDSIFGYPTLDINSEFTKNVLAMKTAQNVLLALSALTTPYELVKAVMSTIGRDGSQLARQQFLYATGNLVKGMFSNPNFKKTWLAEMMTNNVNGLGGATLRGDISFKAVDDIINVNDLSTGNVRDVLKKAGFVGLLTSRLIQLDDFYKNIANIYAATNLARIANGKMVFPAEKMSMYGIDADAINKLKRFLKLDEDDEVLKFDWDSLPQSDKDLFRNITERIVMDRSTWTTLGATPTGSINNAAGVLLSGLTHFMSQTYTTQFIAKAKHGGVSNYADMALWVLSGYTTYYAKAYATGKEPDHEDAIMYAILSSPIASPFNIAGMMIDPIPLSVMQRTAELARSNTEYAIDEVNK